MDKKINKKHKILIAIVFLVIIAFIAFKFLKPNNSVIPHKFSLDNNVLTGSQGGKIALINIASKEVFKTVDLNKEYEKHLKPFLPFYDSPIFGNNTEQDKNPDEITEDIPDEIEKDIPEEINKPIEPTKTIPNSLLNREIKVVGEIDGYDIVSVKIIKGDYWLKIQRRLVGGLTSSKMLNYGWKINGKQPLHPIYSGNVLLFIAEKGLFTDGLVEEEKVVEIKEPEVEIIEEEKEIKEEIVGELKGDAVVTKLVAMDETIKNSSINDYIYSFSNDELYVYDNIKYRLYKLDIVDDDIEIALICDTENVIVKDFEFKNNVFYFTIFDNLNIYAFDGLNFDKIEINAELEDWVAYKDWVFYSTENFLIRTNVKTGEQIHLYLGDETTDIKFINDELYVSNKFGSTVAKSVVHKLDENLVSYGWAEVNYAKDTEIIYEKNKEILLKQNLHSKKDKLVYINTKFEMEYEVALDVFHNNLKAFNNEYIYGMSNDVFYLYNMQGVLIDRIKLDISDVLILN